MARKGKGWHDESRRHSLARKGIKTVIDDNRRLPVNRFVARGTNRVHTWKEINPHTLVQDEGYDVALKWLKRMERMLHRRGLYPNGTKPVMNGIYFTTDSPYGKVDRWFHNFPKTDEDEKLAKTYAQLEASIEMYATDHMNPITGEIE